MIKKFNEIFDYEEEPDEPSYTFVGFYIAQNPTIDSFFIMEEIINDHDIILYDEFHYNNYIDSVWKYCKYVPEEHIKNYIYTNKLPINIYDKDIGNHDNGWKRVFWKDLPQYLKNELE